RALGKRGAVLNGRDIGTVVFPDADIKFFLTAAAGERAERRFKEDVAVKSSTTLAETLSDMIERDARDSSRADSPLKVAGDAIAVDWSGLSIDATFERMMTYVHRNN